MRNVIFEYDFVSDYDECVTWQYAPREDDLKDAIVDVLIEKFGITEDAGVEAIQKLCYRDDDLAWKLAIYYEDELKVALKSDAKRDFDNNYEPREYDEWDEVDIYLDMKAVDDV